MWRLVSEGLRVYRSILFLAWGVTVVGLVLVFAALNAAGVVSAHRAVLWGTTALPMYVLLASAVPGWMAFGTDSQEKRVRLHLTLPVPLREVGLAQILLPASMLLAGLPLAHALDLVAAAVHRANSPWLGHARLDLIAAFLLFLHQLALAIREVTLLKEEGWWRSLLGAVVLGAVATGVVGIAYPVGGFLHTRALAVLAVTVALGAATLALFCRRPHY